MEIFVSAYNYVISAVIGMLVALCAMLVALSVPEGRKYAAYGKARKILILLFATIAVDLALSLLAYRTMLSIHADTIIDILCYTPVALLFLDLTQTLMEYKPRTLFFKRLFACMWVGLVIWGIVNEVLFMGNDIKTPTYKTNFIACTATWVCLILCIAIHIGITSSRAQKQLANTYSDNVARHTEWLRRSFAIFLVWGTASPLAAIGPSWVNTIYGGMGGAVYIYLCVSFINYGHDFVRFKANEPDAKPEPAPMQQTDPQSDGPQTTTTIKEWEESKGYRTPGVTIDMMAASLSIEPRKLASIINEQYNCSFHDYINNLRIRDAQSLLVHFADKDIGEIAAMTGFASEEDMEKAFMQTVYVSPEKWRKGVLSLIG